MVKFSYIEFLHIFLPNLTKPMDACKSPLVNRRGVIPEYLAAYLASPRVPGNVPSRVVVTRSRQRHRLNATLSVCVAIGRNCQPTVSLVKLARLCCLSGAIGRLLLLQILSTTPFCAVPANIYIGRNYCLKGSEMKSMTYTKVTSYLPCLH